MREIQRTVELLLDRGANIEAKDYDGQTPLTACREGLENTETVERLLDRGANTEAKNNVGQTPLTLAILFRRKIQRQLNCYSIAEQTSKLNTMMEQTPLTLAATVGKYRDSWAVD